MLMLGLLIYLELFDEFFNNMFDPRPLEKLTDLLISGLHPRMPPNNRCMEGINYLCL
jgi:hypothetical protein